jgi:hypothetical protein
MDDSSAVAEVKSVQDLIKVELKDIKISIFKELIKIMMMNSIVM